MDAQGATHDSRGTLQRARTAVGTDLDELLYHPSREVLQALLVNPRLSEQHLTVLLSRNDLPREVVTTIVQNRAWMASYSLKLAVLKHPRTPRYLALPLLRFIYLFDLLEVVLAPGAPADLRRVAEDAILSQKEGIALGYRTSLALRGSLRIAAGLLADRHPAVIHAALSNPRLTDQAVAAALLLETTPAELTEAVLNHPRWPLRRPVKLALARNRHLTLARLMAILPEFSTEELADFVSDPRVASSVRAYAARTMNAREARRIK